ncbi:hypothetical protein S101395_03367 [Bacillus sonorensis]|uniref:Uncharacterized protein n=1 Tax=Bacillus sonorensis TaxID=119858 RepID=A0ABM6LKI9_9BACI|nr:hypothetical protein S101395_03367 [Bacillus sonorensis]
MYKTEMLKLAGLGFLLLIGEQGLTRNLSSCCFNIVLKSIHVQFSVRYQKAVERIGAVKEGHVSYT